MASVGGTRGRSPPPLSPPRSPIPALLPRSPPGLGRMLVDHSSFDETDSFCVDALALESTEYSKECHSEFQSPAVVMRDGKVRRRMRWRPKGMMKRRRPRLPLSPMTSRLSSSSSSSGPPVPGLRTNQSSVSSNSSVASASNASQSSKQSKRSLHSFASVETQVKSNTTRSSLQKRRFPLSRPNYSTTLDGIPTEPSSSSSATIVTTISNEGSVSMSGRSNSKATLFEPADSVFPILEERREDDPAESPAARPPLGKAAATGRKASPRAQSTTSLELSKREQELAEASGSLKSARSSPRSEPNGLVVNDTPLPTLSGEEVEQERRVDLRIRVPDAYTIRERTSSNVSGRSGRSLISKQHSSGGVEIDNGVEQQPINNSLSSLSRKKQLPPPSPLSKSSSRLSTTSIDTSKSQAVPRVVDPVIGQRFGTHVLEIQSEDLDDRDEDLNSIPEVPSSSSEIRFQVTNLKEYTEAQMYSFDSHSNNTVSGLHHSSNRPPHTVPVDLDNCSYIEAEKNLQAIHDMALEHLQQGEYDEALDVFEEILRAQLTRYGKGHYRVGTALHNIGIVHMRRGDYSNAAKAYKEAVAVRRKALAPTHPDVASSLAQLGVAYLERRMHKKAIAAFRESLKIRRECLGNTHPKVAKILNNIGCALYELTELEVAQVAFEEALDIQRYNLREVPVEQQTKSNYALLSVASTLSNIASIKLYFNNFDEAIIDFQEALLIQQCVFGDEHPTPLQTEENLKWIEAARAPYPANDSGQQGIFSKLFRRGSGIGSVRGDDTVARLGSEPGILSCVARDESTTRGDFGSAVERRLMALQQNIELACGPPDRECDDEDDIEELFGSKISMEV